MKIQSMRPMLWTANLEETIGFYTNILGFTCDERNNQWASLHKDNGEIMIALPTEHTPFDKPLFTGSFYFSVEDVDDTWESLKDRTTVFYGIENFPYGMREFAILDNNGYILQFGQEIAVETEK